MIFAGSYSSVSSSSKGFTHNSPGIGSSSHSASSAAAVDLKTRKIIRCSSLLPSSRHRKTFDSFGMKKGVSMNGFLHNAVYSTSVQIGN